MIDPARLSALLADLVRTSSINPVLVDGGPGEGAAAELAAAYCREHGLDAEVTEVAPGRFNVAAVLRGRGLAPPLLFNGHLDTVGVEGMTIDPFGAEVRDGRLYGRGAFDMKGGVAAMIEAAVAAAEAGPPPGDVILAMVADEEHASLGTQALLRDGVLLRVGAAVVTEPTGLQICVAHKGFAWFTIETAGRAAHGSRPGEGVDAIAHMGRVLAVLERLEREVYPTRPHPLLGRPSVHASRIGGGLGLSTYPDRCRLQIERRTLPAESAETVGAELAAALDDLARQDPAFSARWSLDLFRPGLEISPSARIVRALRRVAQRVLARPPALVGESAWLDSALLVEARIPTVVFGPAGAGAHAAEEWVDLESVATAAGVLAELIFEWGGERGRAFWRCAC